MLEMELSNAMSNKGSQRLCDPCNVNGKETIASRFCNECEEYLCETCTNNHTQQRDTKLHRLTNIASTKLAKCEPCENEDNLVEAHSYCNTCAEYLCEDCVAVHKRMKATKTHEPKQVSSNEGNTDCFYSSDHAELSATRSDQSKEQMSPLVTQTELLNTPVDSLQNLSENINLDAVRIIDNQEPVKNESTSNESDISHGIKHNSEKSAQSISDIDKSDGEQNKNDSQMTTNDYLCNNNVGTREFANKEREYKSNEEPTEKAPDNRVEHIKKNGENQQNVDYCSEIKVDVPGRPLEDTMKQTVENQEPEDENLSSKQPQESQSEQLDIVEHVNKNGKYTSIRKPEKDDANLKEKKEETDLSNEAKSNVLSTLNDRTESVRNLEPEHGDDIDTSCPVCEYIKENKISSNQCGVCSETFCDECFQKHVESVCISEVSDEKQCIDEICQPCFAVSSCRRIAEMWCEDCEEYICDECLRRHSGTKALRNHILTAIQEKKKKTVEKYCEPCMTMDKENIATNICIDCDEYLCSDCTGYHKAQKVTRAHELKNYSERGILSGTCYKTTSEKIISGQPYALDVGPDTVTLTWEKPNNLEKEDRFQVEYKLPDADHPGWQTFDLEPLKESTAVLECKPKTVYRFRVKCISINKEWPYSLESEDIVTPTSLGTELVNFSRCIKKGQPSPSRFELPVTEWLNARNPAARTRKFEVGTNALYKEEKTILLIGATGTGKSTLVDGLVNYVLGVDWNDPFRFVAVRLEDEEKQKRHNQALSQTEWITTYSINPTDGTRIRYRLNIIDTPGFGDCRGLERDQQIVDQIRELFSATGPQGIAMLDAICFLIKAPDARLTPIQSYIFQYVMSLFGKDVEKNICSLITFADGDEPPVLAALQESKLPFGHYFTFNNSALFAKNTSTSKSSLSKMFWQMGLQSFDEFFKQLENFQPKSLSLTKNVLNERFRLEMTVKNLQPKVDVGLMKIDLLKQEIAMVEQHKSHIKDNANFEYEVTEIKQHKTDLPAGKHVTNCINCNYTCHFPCGIPDDKNKSGCWAMESNGYCRICPDNCFWEKHFNTPYKFEYVSVQVKRTYDDMRAKYKDAMGKLPTQEQLVAKMATELDELVETIEDMMEMVKHCNERLAEIALRPNPLTLTDHIDLMIENEKMERRHGFQRRIQSLNGFRKRAEVSKHAKRLCVEAVSTFSTVGKTRVKRQKDIRALFQSFKSLFGF